MDVPDQPNSMCEVERIEMYHLPQNESKIVLPFALLDGEAVSFDGTTRDGLILLTNFRLYLEIAHSHNHVPLGLIELVEHKDLFYLVIGCKHARTYRCTFENNENCLVWYDRIVKATESVPQLNQLFAFYHFEHCKRNSNMNKNRRPWTFNMNSFHQEMERLQFEKSLWRISEVNKDYSVCSTYPPYLLVPKDINDEDLIRVAKFRSSRRIPAVVWRHTKNGAIIARCSQPEVGWFGWRGFEDEKLIHLISKNYENNVQEKKVLILDARSYTIAVANRARGGGCECPEYYSNCEIQFMNLANIHSIRKSFHALRQLCTSSSDQTWHSQLENTKWLQYMSGLMKAALTLVTAVDIEARPVVVHCSDGWDRTPQIVAFAELIMDPYYRTIEGFRVLIEREWLAFGHKFADRCGHSTGSEDQNERCPVFLQWLDCVHQLLMQFPCAFEFSQAYLVKVVQHTYSNLFGTFLCNTLQERIEKASCTFSVWDFLNCSRYRNHLYEPPVTLSAPKVIWPQCNVRDLHIWKEVYLGTMESNFRIEAAPESCPGPPDINPYPMTRRRSYNDVTEMADSFQGHFRRSSDPSNINSDLKDIPVNFGSQDLCSSLDDASSEHTTELELCNPDCIYKDNIQKAAGDMYMCSSMSSKGNLQPQVKLSSTCQNGHIENDNEDCFLLESVIKSNKTEQCEKIYNLNHLTNDVRTKCTVNDCGIALCSNNIDELDSNLGFNGPMESKSDLTNCDGELLKSTQGSVETSTDTLVSEVGLCGSPKEINGFEKIQSPSEPIDIPDKSKQSFLNTTQSNHFINHPILSLSEMSTSPLFSRTSSSYGWDKSLSSSNAQNPCHTAQHQLGDDGLIPLQSDVQERILKIIEDARRKAEKLEKELHTYRKFLMSQTCLKCNGEKFDDNGSIIESLGSGCEGQASAVESLPSDRSWENLEYSLYPELQGIKWVPDHAVTRCTNCNVKFWIGKRKHHCRKCGNIFCADCSENSTPLPSEHLYDPVRVCTGCFNKLQRDCSDELLGQCKHAEPQQTTSNPQITASSN